MIYFVDEDVNETEPYVYHMRYLGYETKVIDNADDAFDCLLNATDIEAVILDVMLATKQSNLSRYSATSTNNFIITGLTLLDDLVRQRDESLGQIPSKVILFSAATREEIVDKISAAADQHGILYLNKLEYDDVDYFSEVVIKTINGD